MFIIEGCVRDRDLYRSSCEIFFDYAGSSKSINLLAEKSANRLPVGMANFYINNRGIGKSDFSESKYKQLMKFKSAISVKRLDRPVYKNQ